MDYSASGGTTARSTSSVWTLLKNLRGLAHWLGWPAGWLVGSLLMQSCTLLKNLGGLAPWLPWVAGRDRLAKGSMKAYSNTLDARRGTLDAWLHGCHG